MNTREFGRLGESAAAQLLREKGFCILAQNLQVSHDEIDLLAEDDTFLVFAEVKTRRQDPTREAMFGTPADAVDKNKQSHLVRGAQSYLAAHPTDKTPRIDVIEVYADPASECFRVLKIEHYENAVQRRGKFSHRPRLSDK